MPKITQGQQQQNNQDDGGDEQTALLTEEQQQQVAEIVAKTVGPLINKGFDNRFSRVKGDLEKTLADTVSKAIEGLKPLAGEQQLQQGEQGKDAQGGKPADIENHPTFRAMKAQVDEMKGAVDSEKKARLELEAKRLQDEEQQLVEKALSGSGVSNPVMLAAARAHLASGKRFGRSETDAHKGKVVFLTADKDGYQIESPIEEGVKAWLKTDEGKNFMPATGAGGAGDKKGNPPSNRRVAGADQGDPRKMGNRELGEGLLAWMNGSAE